MTQPDALGSRWDRWRRALIGPPRNLHDRSVFHQLALIPFLAWVGLGADGLSSAAYGPPESFAALGEHTYLSIGLAAMTAATVLLIAAAYNRIIEVFPHGGGGYVVATKLLGGGAGVVSGAALLVDYVLTITVSVAAAWDALGSLLPPSLAPLKLAAELITILAITVLNLRGIRESILPLVPIFLLFLATHVPALLYVLANHLGQLPQTAQQMGREFHHGLDQLGWLGMLALFARAYSLGGGTYTGLEAVSNGLPLLREPRVPNGKRTMAYMSLSLAFMAGGIMLSYVLQHVHEEPQKTLNAVLFASVYGQSGIGQALLVLTMIGEGALLIVAVQTGFLDGPRVLANMAGDGWMPRRFASLSERLTTQDGILLMGGASLLALLYTGGDIRQLVVMFSINVFITFTLSMAGMLRWSWQKRRQPQGWQRIGLFLIGLTLCSTILGVTVYMKFSQGGRITLAVTAALVGLCFAIRHHYRQVNVKLAQLERDFAELPLPPPAPPPSLQPDQPTAIFLVGGYGGLGIHTVLTVLRIFPHLYKNLVFVSVGIIDSGDFKGEQELQRLEQATIAGLDRYRELASRLGIGCTTRYALGTDPVDELERLCVPLSREFPRGIFFAGQVIFQRERMYHAILHNQTAYAIQKRLQWEGLTMVILPVRVRDQEK